MMQAKISYYEEIKEKLCSLAIGILLSHYNLYGSKIDAGILSLIEVLCILHLYKNDTANLGWSKS